MYRSKSEHKEFYFHHIFQAATDESTNSEEPKHSARNYSTMQQAFYHSLRIDAKLEILQKYKYKFSNTLQFRRTAKFLRRLHSPIRIHPQKRLKDWNATLEYFFNAKTYNSEEFEFLRIFFICFTFYGPKICGAEFRVPESSHFE